MVWSLRAPPEGFGAVIAERRRLAVLGILAGKLFYSQTRRPVCFQSIGGLVDRERNVIGITLPAHDHKAPFAQVHLRSGVVEIC